MSEKRWQLTADAVDLLLSLIETTEMRLTGAAAELCGDAFHVLRQADFLIAQGHEDVAASGADYDDVPVSLIPIAGGGLGYFDPLNGLVRVPDEQLLLYAVRLERALQSVALSLGIKSVAPMMELISGHLWELGSITRETNRPAIAPVWFARCLWDGTVRLLVDQAVQSRPHRALRVILTTTPADRLHDISKPGIAIISLADVLTARDRIAVDRAVFDARIGSAPIPDDTAPISLSPDGQVLRIRGTAPISFKSSTQIDAIRKLLRGRQQKRLIPVAELTQHGSLQRLFGTKKWRQLSPYLKSGLGGWRFEV